MVFWCRFRGEDGITTAVIIIIIIIIIIKIIIIIIIIIINTLFTHGCLFRTLKDICKNIIEINVLYILSKLNI